MTTVTKKPPLYLMLLLVCIGSVGAVLYTPALPLIAEHFQISDHLVEFSMTIYLIGYALGQLPFGPISNRFGRKKALYSGLFLAIFGAFLSILSAYTHNYLLFIVARFLFALGATAGLQVIYTVIGDLYVPPKSIQIASYMTLVFAMSPSISTTIGGFLTQYLGWLSCFYFLIIYCIVLVFLCKFLPETLQEKEKHALKLKNFIGAYVSQLKDRKVMYVSIIIGLAISFNYTFATMAPTIAIRDMKISPSFYGLFNIIPSIALVLGAILSGLLATRHLAQTKAVLYAIIMTFLGTMLMLGLFLTSELSIYSLFIPYAIALLGQPIIETNTLCLALDYHKNKAITSAVINCVTIGICGIFSLLSSLLGSSTALYIPLVFLLLSSLIFYLYGKLKKIYAKKAP